MCGTDGDFDGVNGEKLDTAGETGLTGAVLDFLDDFKVNPSLSADSLRNRAGAGPFLRAARKLVVFFGGGGGGSGCCCLGFGGGSLRATDDFGLRGALWRFWFADSGGGVDLLVPALVDCIYPLVGVPLRVLGGDVLERVEAISPLGGTGGGISKVSWSLPSSVPESWIASISPKVSLFESLSEPLSVLWMSVVLKLLRSIL